MATGYNPKIVTDGLVFCVDAANVKSYPGTGTTWTDLSSGNYDATLVNAPTYTADPGRFTFDGTTHTATFSNPLGQTATGQTWTVSAWINITEKVTQHLISGLNNGISVCYSQGNNSLLYLNSGANDYYTYGGDLGVGDWVLATFRFDNSDGTRTIYKNTTNISTSGPNNTSTPSGQSGTFTLGSGLEGDIAIVTIYNRMLTSTELQQNFDAHRGRFGL